MKRRRLLVVGLLTLTAVGWQTSPTSPAHVARATTPSAPWKTYSYEIGNISSSVITQLGTTDGNNYAAHCIHGVTVLDFGRPILSGQSAYGGYGTNRPSSTYGAMGNDDVVTVAKTYLNAWYHVSGTCSTLDLALGTSNFEMCYSGSTLQPGCQFTTAGSEWASVVRDVQSWVSSTFAFDQIRVDGADDIEGGWDCPIRTDDFLDGFDSNHGTRNYYDFGDFALSNCIQGKAWTNDDFYHVAWAGYFEALPLPEVYESCQEQRVLSFNKTYRLVRYQGTMANVGSDNCGGYSAATAWQTLYADLAANGLRTDELRWSTLFD